jgi:Glycosyltransferase family 87
MSAGTPTGEGPFVTIPLDMDGQGHGALSPRSAARRIRGWATAAATRWGAEGGDAVLYGLAAMFALLSGLLAGLASYRLWGWIALGPYLVAAGASVLLARRRRTHASRGNGAHQWGPARVWIFLVVLMGATLVPLAAEISLRSDGVATGHVQPEVLVIDQASVRLADGKDPYHAIVEDGRVKSTVPGEPVYESFFPYLPVMAVFGLPSSTHEPVRLTDTRIVFSVVTLLVVGIALLLLRGPPERTMRTLQFLTVLPTAALPLATGGDDMPVVAFLLLAIVLAQRRRPGWSGFVLGIVSSMKFTAWPLAALALFAARDREGRRAPGRMLLGMLVVAGPVVTPFALSNVRAFFDNVILFPLGMAGVTSPASSNLPGHILVKEVPWAHTLLAVAAVVLGALLVHHLVRRPPSTAAAVCTLAGWVMLVAICLAPATRVGYLLYPANFFVWGWMFSAADGSRDEPEHLLAAAVT